MGDDILRRCINQWVGECAYLVQGYRFGVVWGDVEARDSQNGARVISWVKADCAIFELWGQRLNFGEFLRSKIAVDDNNNTTLDIFSQWRGAAVVGYEHIVIEFDPFQLLLSKVGFCNNADAGLEIR